jgi:L-ascorbate metabolism protein UlaG (beta-lactamase superfamily)
MVPIDGTYTMSLDGISDITKRLRASVVLPMHRFMIPARRLHAQDRPGFCHRCPDGADAVDFAGGAAIGADGDYSG